MKKKTDTIIKEILERNVAEIVVRESLEKKLKSGRPLRIKHGVDPTTRRLHIGHASVYHKLRDFQELGHTIFFLIGDFTARFGDPTGKNIRRPLRRKDEIMALIEDYKEQVGKILDMTAVELRLNGEWYDRMSLDELMRILSHFTASRMLERDMFMRRLKEGNPVFLHELLYPALQAYDSVVLQSDVTVIGSDQLFNEMQARHLQEVFKQPPQDIVALDLMLGTSGKRKMSQSLNNAVDILDDPKTQFGKIMSIPDNLIVHYWLLATRRPRMDIQKIEQSLKNKILHPMEAKKNLAYEIVRFYHGEKEAESAVEQFTDVFQEKNIPKNIPCVSVLLPKKLVDIALANNLVTSKSEFRRLLQSKSIEIDQKIVIDPLTIITKTSMVRIGKLRFLKIDKA